MHLPFNVQMVKILLGTVDTLLGYIFFIFSKAFWGSSLSSWAEKVMPSNLLYFLYFFGVGGGGIEAPKLYSALSYKEKG